jgi:hypothetical protein
MAATHHGIRLSLEFFDDIFIPAHFIFDIASLYPLVLRYFNASDHATQSWKLPVSATEFNYLEKDDMIRFKVEEETFKEATPAPPKAHGSGEIDHRPDESKEPIYSLIVRLPFDKTNDRGVVRKMDSELQHGGKIKGYPLHSHSIYRILLGTPKLSFHLVFVVSPVLKRLATAADRSPL